MVFDGFRRSFDELLARATRPEERRAIASRMKETLVQARMGLDDLRGGIEKAKARLAAEERELETVRRRKQLAEGINDAETVGIAAKYETTHAERVEVLRQKLAAQEAELQLAERDVAQMSAELKAALSGADPRVKATVDQLEADRVASEAAGGDGSLGSELDALGRARASAEREAEADRRLDELKRRMGK